MILTISPLVICWLLGLLANILTANGKYRLQDCENLLTPVQMQVSWKVKRFSDFFVPFLETILNFEHFEKKIIVMSTLYRKLQTVKDLVRTLSKKHRFGTPFCSQHVKVSQPFVKCAWEYVLLVFHYSEKAWFINISLRDMLTLRIAW